MRPSERRGKSGHLASSSFSGLGGTNHEHERRDRVGNPPTSLRRYDERNSRRVSMRYHAHALRSTRTDPDDDDTTVHGKRFKPKGDTRGLLPAKGKDRPKCWIPKGVVAKRLQEEKYASSPFGTISSILRTSLRTDSTVVVNPLEEREQQTEGERRGRMRGLSGRSGRHALGRSLERHMRWDT